MAEWRKTLIFVIKEGYDKYTGEKVATVELYKECLTKSNLVMKCIEFGNWRKCGYKECEFRSLCVAYSKDLLDYAMNVAKTVGEMEKFGEEVDS